MKVVDMFIRRKCEDSVLICAISIFFLSFIAGYYWGKQSSLGEIRRLYGQEALTDRLSYGLVCEQKTID